uniref:Uncharacterized protein n=1 Tax=Caenorhabditis japonica TaxID=281687 RepID=A0A8R1DUM3_CAEJA
MDVPGCSKVLWSTSEDSDIPELPSVLPHSPKRSDPPKEGSPRPVRHERPTECSVCMKFASGYHYGVPSCNGCKTFFRRLCISGKKLACKGKGDCYDLTIREEPLKCQACRYKKCKTTGMDPLAIQIDEKEASTTDLNKVIKRVNPDNIEKDDGTQKGEMAVQKQVIKTIQSMEVKMQKMVDMLVYLESKIEKLRMSSYNPHWNTWGNLEELLASENKIRFADKAAPMPGWPLKGETCPRRLPNCGKGPKYSPDRKQWFFYDMMTTIEYAKTFMFIHQLDMRDRMILIRNVALAVMNLHISYFTVSKKYDTVVHPDGSLAPMKLGMVYSETVMSISPLIRCEIQSIEYLLLKAICLCNPAVPDLSVHAQEILAREREQFATALFDHCLRTRKNGPAQYAELIGMVDLLERQQRMQKDLHLLYMIPIVSKIPFADRMHLIDDIMSH